MSVNIRRMKKIDILNFITDNRKSPNDIKTHTQLLSFLNLQDDTALNTLLSELERTKVLRQLEKNGERAYQVIAR